MECIELINLENYSFIDINIENIISCFKKWAMMVSEKEERVICISSMYMCIHCSSLS